MSPGDGHGTGAHTARPERPIIRGIRRSSHGAYQSGIEYQSGLGPCGRHFACYAAVDVSTMQERNWRVDVTADVGIVMQGLGRTSRIFLEWHDGRPTANEFFLDSVSSFSVGLEIDL